MQKAVPLAKVDGLRSASEAINVTIESIPVPDPDRKNAHKEAKRRKQAAHAVLQEHREKVLLLARRALLRVLLERGNATADDIRESVTLPAGINPTLFGAVPTPLAEKGLIRRVGYEHSCRPKAHHRPVSQWKLADRIAASQWLKDNPEPAPIQQSLPFESEGTANVV